jgi:hypothetical protein
MFSILTQEFRNSEIKSLPELIQKICDAPVKPKPTCESLWWTWDWKSYVEDKLSNKDLQNHSFYNCFQIKKVNGMTKLRAKPLPQDTVWTPDTGIRLIKENITFEDPVGVADFRIEKLELPKVYRDLIKYFKRMPTHTRTKVSSDWDNLISQLESLPRRQHNLPKLRLEMLPKMSTASDEPQLPDEYEFVEENEVPPLIGDVYHEDAEDGVFENNVICGMDVVVYTESKEKRPWCGRVLEILAGNQFVIQWFGRRGKGNKFHALTNRDGSAYSTELEMSVVMFWEICESKQENSFILSHVWMNKIMLEYAKYDDDTHT